jgi:hypothetical protein
MSTTIQFLPSAMASGWVESEYNCCSALRAASVLNHSIWTRSETDKIFACVAQRSFMPEPTTTRTGHARTSRPLMKSSSHGTR